jgi:hypothetical protein
MDALQWATPNLGKGSSALNPLNPTPPNILYGECVYGASSYSVASGRPNLIGDTAWDIYSSFNVGSSYQRINAPVNPQANDIVFYLPNNSAVGTDEDGHVDVCTVSFNGSTFQAADVNWNSDPNLQLVNHGLTGVAGVFRPINNQGEEMLDNDTALALAYYVYGLNGFNGTPNAFDGGAGSATVLKQFTPLIGQPTNLVFQEMRDDQYGHAFKNNILIPALEGKPGTTPTVLAPGTYQVN